MCILPEVFIKYLKPIARDSIKSSADFHLVLVCFNLVHPTVTHANGLIAVDALVDEHSRFGGHLDHCDDELESSPQEDGVLEVSASFQRLRHRPYRRPITQN
jgi:hypothetical protein